MLEKSSVLFINCLGSYFYSIFEAINNQNDKNILLYYLSSGSLRFNKISLKHVKEKYGNNSWGYQPIDIKDNQNNRLEINESFFRYIKEKHNITVDEVDLNYGEDLFEVMKKIDSVHFLICCVDEYYVSTSNEFYMRQHNKHFLLVRNAWVKLNQIELIDSEKNKSIFLSYSELEQATYHSAFKQKKCYLVNCQSYENSINPQEMLNNFLTYGLSNDYLIRLIDEIKENKEIIEEGDGYFFEGYYYNIQSKIYPYFSMLNKLLIDNGFGLYKQGNDLRLRWQDLRDFMLFKKVRKKYSIDSVVRKLERILAEENNLLIQVGLRPDTE